MKTVITSVGPEVFFKRGKQVAQLAVQGKPIPRERTISFEDPDSEHGCMKEVRALAGQVVLVI